jgi:hypothetical protein
MLISELKIFQKEHLAPEKSWTPQKIFSGDLGIFEQQFFQIIFFGAFLQFSFGCKIRIKFWIFLILCFERKKNWALRMIFITF